MRKTLKHVLRMTPIAIVLALALGHSTPVRAEVTCTRDLLSCYGRAAAFTDSWWSMWAYGLDCELSFTDCTRRALIGR